MEPFSLPEISVVVVSDYTEDHNSQKSWADERNILTSLAQQDFKEPFDVILVENERFGEKIPPDIKDIIPNLKLLFSPFTSSAELKDYGVSKTSSPLVAILEADCTPKSNWLRVLVDGLRRFPHVSAISGKSIYGMNNLWQRAFSLLDRGYMDLGCSGPITSLSNCSALYRRDLLDRYKYPKASSPFVSASLRLKEIRRSGHILFWEPRAIAIHAFGWKLEKICGGTEDSCT